MLNVLSLGAGVQSTALLLMSIRGELDRLDCAICADTGWDAWRRVPASFVSAVGERGPSPA